MSAAFSSDVLDARRAGTSMTGAMASSAVTAEAEAIGFIAGTRIATPMGYVAVERLTAGDRVLTASGRHARLIWVGTTRAPATGACAPVRFETGVMDNMRPLRLGQGHRVRVAGWRAELLFDTEAVLATAKTFVNGEDVVIEEAEGSVTYVHLMFERHEVVLAENVACETLRPGPDGIAQLDEMTRRALLAERPEMSESRAEAEDAVALPLLSAAEARVLIAA